MKNALIITLIFSALIIGLAIFGKTEKRSSSAKVQGVQSTNTKSNLVATSTFYDFGTISMKNGDVTKNFLVTNPTDKPIYLSSVVTSCMCTKAFLVLADGKTKGPFGMPSMGYVPPADENIGPGESRIIRVVYDPNAHGPAGVGQIDRFITLTDKTGGSIIYEIKALITP